MKFTNAYANLCELVEGIDGWTPEDQLFALYLTALYTKGLEGDVLEIGSWCGRSSVVLGKAAQQLGVKLHCVDLFPNKEDWYENADGTYSFAVEIDGEKYGGYGTQTVYKEPFENAILSMYNKQNKGTLEIFKENIKNRGLENIIKPYKGDSSVFDKIFQGKLRFAFVDGDHSYEATRKDIEVVENYLVCGGFIAFDDAFSYYEGVNEAIREFIIDSKKYDLYQQVTRKCFIARKK